MNRREVLASTGLPLAASICGCLEPPLGGDDEFELTDLTVSTSTDGPPVTYVLESTAVHSESAVDRESGEQVVIDISEVEDAEVRDALETAIETDGWRSNTLPVGLADTVERVDFVTGVTSAAYVGVRLYEFDPDRPPAIEFTATVVDASITSESPGTIEFELTNTSSTSQEVFSGSVPPFGMVIAEASEGDDRFLLWREYEEEGCISFTDRGISSCAVGVYTSIQPNESLTRRYDILSGPTAHHPEYTVPPGPNTYRITDTLAYNEEPGAPSTGLTFEVTFRLEAV